MPEIEERTIAQGVFAALLTPRKINTTDADAAAQLEYIDHVLTAGVDGVVLFGSTGEFVHFSIDERTRVIGSAPITARAAVTPRSIDMIRLIRIGRKPRPVRFDTRLRRHTVLLAVPP